MINNCLLLSSWAVVKVTAFGLNPSFLVPSSIRGTLIPDRKGDSFSLGLSLCPKENNFCPVFFSPVRGLQKEMLVAETGFPYETEGFSFFCPSLTFIWSEFTNGWGHCVVISWASSASDGSFLGAGLLLTLLLPAFLPWAFFSQTGGPHGQSSQPTSQRLPPRRRKPRPLSFALFHLT